MPNSSRDHNGLGIILADKGDFDVAELHFRAALRHKPNDLEVALNLENLYELRELSEDLKQHSE